MRSTDDSVAFKDLTQRDKLSFCIINCNEEMEMIWHQYVRANPCTVIWTRSSELLKKLNELVWYPAGAVGSLYTQ